MSVIEEAIKLPVSEQIALMETLWNQLNKNDHNASSPEWHKAELELTEKNIATGKEEVIDWEIAKKQLQSL